MQRVIFVLLGLILVGAIVVGVIDARGPTPPERGGETNDRLTEKAMERFVQGPMTLVDRGDLAGAKRRFEAELAALAAKEGETSLEVADMLTSFAVALYRHSEAGQRESIPYFRRAIPAYRAARGAEDPEVALALHSYAEALLVEGGEAPSPEALGAMREAVRIRVATLGLKNGETAVAYGLLGELNGMPANTRGDPARIAAAAQQARYAIALLPDCPNADAGDLAGAYRRLARIYARNGMRAETIETMHSSGIDFGEEELAKLGEQLERAGDEGATEALHTLFGTRAPTMTPSS